MSARVPAHAPLLLMFEVKTLLSIRSLHGHFCHDSPAVASYSALVVCGSTGHLSTMHALSVPMSIISILSQPACESLQIRPLMQSSDETLGLWQWLPVWRAEDERGESISLGSSRSACWGLFTIAQEKNCSSYEWSHLAWSTVTASRGRLVQCS